jgi:uncharacterized protein
MGKNLPPFSKALILFVYFSTIFMMAVLSGGSDTDVNLSNPEAITTFKLLQAFSELIVFIIPALLFVLFTSEKKIIYLKLTSFNPQFAFIVLLLVFSAMPLINWLGEINSHMTLPAFLSNIENWMKVSEEKAKVLTKAFMIMDSPLDLLINITVIALLAAVGEEFLFRGALQNVLVEWTGKIHLSVWISAIIFSALHAQFYGFLPRMLLGVVLGYLYIWSGSLWLSILFHFLNNGFAVLFSYLIGKDIITDKAETIGAGDTPILIIIASTTMSLGLMYYLYKNRETEPLALS